MKIVKENINLNFDRSESNPLTKLDIGRGWKGIVKDFKKALEKLRIYATENDSFQYGPEVREFILDDLDNSDNIINSYQLSYATKKIAKEQFEDIGDYGFQLADEDGNILVDSDYTGEKIIKYLTKEKYGDLKQVKEKIKNINKNIQELQDQKKNLEEFIQKLGNK
ncbi:MAG: hypothetical protein PHF86_02570 [Candidatus Nanoarchaeia archaeon]|nr:hypothetical protein [Candidatus Nanoarchaeia archaeon]